MFSKYNKRLGKTVDDQYNNRKCPMKQYMFSKHNRFSVIAIGAQILNK